jgi:solute carrier family 25 iron transporter 28/37
MLKSIFRNSEEPITSTNIKTYEKENLVEKTTEQDYESLPSQSFLVNAGAGTLAGIAEHCVMFPVDSIKTRLQMITDGTTASTKSIYSLKGLWKGVGSMFMGAGPAHAVYYGSYEYFKHKMNIDEGKSHVKEATAGAIATVLSEAVLNPFDVIKQRMQVQSSKGMVNCGLNILRKEGIGAFYVSYPTTLLMNIPFNSIHFIIYEYYRKKLNPTGKYDPKSHIIAGAMAGGIASIITNPLDVSKTLLQLRGTSADSAIVNANGLWQASKIIYRRNGLIGFTKGMVPRMLYNMPSTAISWTAYEFCKYFLNKKKQSNANEIKIYN